MRNYYRAPLINGQVDGPALTASSVATSILPAHAKYTINAGVIDAPGMMFKVTATGRVSNIVTSPGTLTLDLRFGSVIVANGGAMSLNVVAKTNVPWYLEWILTCRSIGNSTNASMFHQGKWESESVIGAGVPTAGGAGVAMLPNAAPAVGTGFDSTAGFVVDLFATWSANNANSITCHQFLLEQIN